MKLINREFYLNKLIDAKGTPDIKVITGIRRCGKSKLMEMYIDWLCTQEESANIIHINYNLPEYAYLLDHDKLYEYIRSKYLPQVNNYVFIDEVQMCVGFEKAINGLHASEQFDIYITGSNAFLLSSDLATLFTGRTYEVAVYPFSFKEYIKYFETTDIQSAFNDYLKNGGMPGSYLYNNADARMNYVREIFQTLIVRDIFQKHSIKNVGVMNSLIDYMLDNISNLTSANNIANALSNEFGKQSNKTISNYMQYLCLSYVFYRVRRYDIKGKKYLSTNDKYYLSDHAIRYAKLGTKNQDTGRMLENIVALELMRRGYEVYVGILYQKEVDFVAIKKDEKLYIQVSNRIDDPATFEREVSPLLSIKDAYTKMIIARTFEDEYQYEGIKILDIAEWLAK